MIASCSRGGSATRSFVVVGALIAPKIVVQQSGFSVRNRVTGSSIVSYGLLLRNLSPNVDALNVNILVNMVMANDRVIGTDVHTIAGLPAGKTFAYGSSLIFPGGAPVERLEVVIQVPGRQRAALNQPAPAGIRLAPSVFEPAWLGSVEGEIINGHPTLALRNTQLWAVVFDAAGNIVGGGTGFAFATLPPGTRQAFKVMSGVSAIPMLEAVSAQVSALSYYGPPGT